MYSSKLFNLFLILIVVTLDLVLACSIAKAEDLAKVRKEAHKYLFEDFIKEKRCVFSEDKRALREVVIFDEEKTISGDLSIDLPEGTEKVMGVFSHIILRGENLDKEIILTHQPYGALTNLKQDFRSPNEVKFLIHSFPPLNGDKKAVTLRFKIEGEAQIKEIALATSFNLTSTYDAKQTVFVGELSIAARRQLVFRLATMARSFEELAVSLDESSEAFGTTVLAASIPSSPEPFIDVMSILVDRRVAKIYEGLANMESHQAEKIASDNFDRQFSGYMPLWEGGTAKIPVSVPSNFRYAVNAHLFLCSEFCPPETVLEKIDQWSTWHETTGSIPTVGPSPLYIANLYVKILKNQRGMTLDETNAWLQQNFSSISTTKFPPLESELLLVSDWSDDNPTAISIVPVFKTWTGTGLLDHVSSKVVLDLLRKQVDQQLLTKQP